LGLDFVHGRPVNAWGPYPTNLYYYEFLNTHTAKWISDGTILEMVWFDVLPENPGKWWDKHLTLPKYCQGVKECQTVNTRRRILF